MFLNCWSRRCNPRCCFPPSFSYSLPNPYLDRFFSPETSRWWRFDVVSITADLAWRCAVVGNGENEAFWKPQCQGLKTLNHRSASWFCRWPRSEGPACSASLAAGWGALPRQMLLREVPQVTGHQGQKEKVFTGLGHIAMTETQEDDPRQRSTGDT